MNRTMESTVAYVWAKKGVAYIDAFCDVHSKRTDSTMASVSASNYTSYKHFYNGVLDRMDSLEDAVTAQAEYYYEY